MHQIRASHMIDRRIRDSGQSPLKLLKWHIFPCILLNLWGISMAHTLLPAEKGPTATPPRNNVPKDVESPFIKQGQLDLPAVIKHFEDLYRSDSSISEVVLSVTKPRRQRKLAMKVWTQGQERVLVLIQSPAKEKGTATLKVDRNLWNYLPRIKRTIRIPPSMMQASWMGSDFTNDDLVREASLSQDYSYELIGASQTPPGWSIRFTAKPGVVGLWKRIEWIVSQDGMLPLEAKYYDRKDRLSRIMTWSDVKELGGKTLPARMTLIPADKEGHKTEMVYQRIDFEKNVPNSMFSLARLEQIR
jgi:hypothetical protein